MFAPQRIFKILSNLLVKQSRTTREKLNGIQIESPHIATYMWAFIVGWQFRFMEKSERFSVSGILKTIHRFSDWLAGLTRFSIQLYSQLWFITKECKTKSVKEKSAWSKVLKKPGASFQEPSPSGVPQNTLNSSNNNWWQHVWNVIYQGSLLDTQCPRFGGGWGTLCLACTEIPDSQKERSYSA